MVCGLAPGSPALTLMTGTSTWGIGDTGSRVYARIPAIRTPSASNEVATGRRLNGAEMFILGNPDPELGEGEEPLSSEGSPGQGPSTAGCSPQTARSSLPLAIACSVVRAHR